MEQKWFYLGGVSIDAARSYEAKTSLFIYEEKLGKRAFY